MIVYIRYLSMMVSSIGESECDEIIFWMQYPKADIIVLTFNAVIQYAWDIWSVWLFETQVRFWGYSFRIRLYPQKVTMSIVFVVLFLFLIRRFQEIKLQIDCNLKLYINRFCGFNFISPRNLMSRKTHKRPDPKPPKTML